MASDTAPIDKELQREAKDRITDCRSQKSLFLPAITEAYFFAAPERCRQLQSSVAVNRMPPTDQAELQISFAMEQAEDFTTTLISAFMPEEADWADLAATTDIPEEHTDEVTEDAQRQRKIVFKLLRESNFYAELALSLNPDAAVGTFAMMIEMPKLHQPVRCMSIPLRELEVNTGPDGSTDTRFAVRHTKARYVRSLIGKEIKLPAELAKKIDAKPKQPIEVAWGFWRLWDEEVETWQKVVMVDKQVVFEERLTGEGCCPLICPRFNPHPEYPFGNGPLIKAAPELRTLDEMRAGQIDNIGLSLRPPMTYPDDSFVNVENGVEEGAWYPIRPGTQDAIKKMYEPNKLDAVYFDQTALERRVKRMFYNDFPEQRGDTPPTATQWVDEMAMAQRRIGTPGKKFWAEGPGEIFKRFMWCAEKRGLTKPITAGGRPVYLCPNNPTQRAKDQQDVANVVRGAQIGAQFWPEEFKGAYDGTEALKLIFKKLGVSDMIPARAPEQIKQAVSMISQLQGGGAQNTNVQPGQLGGPAPMAGG